MIVRNLVFVWFSVVEIEQTELNTYVCGTSRAELNTYVCGASRGNIKWFCARNSLFLYFWNVLYSEHRGNINLSSKCFKYKGSVYIE